MVDPIDVLTIENHILTDECIKNGGIFKLPIKIENASGKIVDYVLIPPQQPEIINDKYVLSNIQFHFDRLIHMVREWEDYHIEDPDFYDEQVSINVRLYWNAITLDLAGKKGRLNTNIYNHRAEGSFRGVICHCPWIEYDEIALPIPIYKKMAKYFYKHCGETTEFAWAIVFRQPVLHDQSFRKLTIRKWDKPTIGMAPPYTKGMNADFDGDWAFGLMGLPGMNLQEDWTSLEWDHEMKLGESLGPVDINNYQEEIEGIMEVHNFSLCAEDILNEDSDTYYILDCCESLKKDDINKWINGNLKDLRESDLEIASGIIIGKLWIGMIGNFAKMLWLIADQNVTLMKSFAHIIERASQELFDSKHGLAKRFGIIIDLLESKLSVRTTMPLLSSILDENLSKPFFDFMTEIERNEITIREIITNRCPLHFLSNDASVSNTGLIGFEERINTLNALIEDNGFNSLLNTLTERIKNGQNFISRQRQKDTKKTPSTVIAGQTVLHV